MSGEEEVPDSDLEQWEIDARTFLAHRDWEKLKQEEEEEGEEADDDERNAAFNKRVKQVTKARMRLAQAPAQEWWNDVSDEESELETDDEEEYDGGNASDAEVENAGQRGAEEDGEDGEDGKDEREERDEQNSDGEDSDSADAAASKKRKWRKAFVGMEERIKMLQTENEHLKKENARLTTAFTQACRRVALAPSTSLGSQSHQARADIMLHQIFTTPQGVRLEDVPAPYRFTGTHAFPHAVDVSKTTKFKQFQVEMRRKITLRFALTKTSDGSKATEYDLAPSGLVSYKMAIMYADGIAQQCPVSIGDFARSNSESIITPSTEMTSIRNVVNGELTFPFNFTVCSSETHPRHRAFLVQVRPTNDEFRDNERLIATTPAFVVRHKVSAARG